MALEKTSLAMIAGEVGITKPSIYYHFASRMNWWNASFDNEAIIISIIISPDRNERAQLREKLYQGDCVHADRKPECQLRPESGRHRNRFWTAFGN